MELTIHLYGITRDIIGQSRYVVQLPPGARVQQLLESVRTSYPELAELKSLLVAVNEEYAEAETPLSERDEIALIPPVSGG
ncbi:MULTISPECIES: MoaD/ThiS family protein [Siphonobacter]|uniref:Molybdopterin synthase sulfur carrier subunit n=1 Tax=Siphonobacter curvatus TaxID=2094562 RepID=A0A2S7IS34_9BACT|nr:MULTISPECIES: MoaD/ThiS family protein [Siphonobacter]PMD96637.1 molybdopterin synthase sulfur carrier subunit [Siphonobacter sp. BAB-5405]PQA60489.1 MoaD/ThiS family protein [Siphonobacter curvatus]